VFLKHISEVSSLQKQSDGVSDVCVCEACVLSHSRDDNIS